MGNQDEIKILQVDQEKEWSEINHKPVQYFNSLDSDGKSNLTPIQNQHGNGRGSPKKLSPKTDFSIGNDANLLNTSSDSSLQPVSSPLKSLRN